MAIQHLPYTVDPDKNRFHFYENHWKAVSLALLLRHVSAQDKTLLDYGCGRGEMLKLAAAHGLKPKGTDVDPECLRLAGQYAPVEALHVADPVAQFGRKSFDFVSCLHVLEHVENPKQTLTALARTAREAVLLAVPNLRQLHGLFERRFELSGVNPGHLQSWDHWHLRSLAERHCGLRWVAWASDTTVLPLMSNLSQSSAARNSPSGSKPGCFGGCSRFTVFRSSVCFECGMTEPMRTVFFHVSQTGSGALAGFILGATLSPRLWPDSPTRNQRD